MSHIDFTWHTTTPPAPDVYTTRRNESKYTTHRYWDGTTWWEIAYSNSRGGKPFTWPKGSRTRQPRRPIWDKSPRQLYIRKISAHLGEIMWGCPFRVYDDKEVLQHLVNSGILPADWRTAYQSQMRALDPREVRA